MKVTSFNPSSNISYINNYIKNENHTENKNVTSKIEHSPNNAFREIKKFTPTPLSFKTLKKKSDMNTLTPTIRVLKDEQQKQENTIPFSYR